MIFGFSIENYINFVTLHLILIFQNLYPAPVASKVRFLPHSVHPRTVCMRVELYGCPYNNPVITYTAPVGDEFSPGVSLLDIYDGSEEGGVLSGGLGLLTDGDTADKFSISESGNITGKSEI